MRKSLFLSLLILPFLAFANVKQDTPYANWMGQTNFKNLTLAQIAIPGSHDSGTYDISGDSRFSAQRDIPKWVEKVHFVRSVVAAWAKTQPFNVKQQLEAGIRYIDVRTCYDNQTDQFYTCHTLLGAKLNNILADVKSFIAEHPKEIVILDFNHFYGMTPELYQRLTKQLLADFQNQLVLPKAGGFTTPIETLKKEHKNIVILYRDPNQGDWGKYFWPQSTITSPWPDKNKANKVIGVLKNELVTPVNPVGAKVQRLFVLQTIATETFSTIAFQGGLHHRNLMEWEAVNNPSYESFINSNINNANINIIIMDDINSYASPLVKACMKMNALRLNA